MRVTNRLLRGRLRPRDAFSAIRYKINFRKDHPEYFDPEGLLVFSGVQGSGKTLSAVQYCLNILKEYPNCIFCSNVKIEGVDFIPYDGIESLTSLENGYAGVLYLIDEMHLEFNSLESKNISIEEMTEIAQQRKQRKHIVGTSQVFMRLAKAFREQVHDVIMCNCHFGLLQHNVWMDGTTATEEDGKLIGNTKGNFWFFHNQELYGAYDTYAKMHRYKKEWQGHATPQAAYQAPTSVIDAGGKGKKK